MDWRPTVALNEGLGVDKFEDWFAKTFSERNHRMIEWDDGNQHIVGEKEKVKNLCEWAWNAAKETYMPRWISTSISNPAKCGFYMVRKHGLGNSVFLESFDGEFFLNKTSVSEWLEIPERRENAFYTR